MSIASEPIKRGVCSMCRHTKRDSPKETGSMGFCDGPFFFRRRPKTFGCFLSLKRPRREKSAGEVLLKSSDQSCTLDKRGRRRDKKFKLVNPTVRAKLKLDKPCIYDDRREIRSSKSSLLTLRIGEKQENTKLTTAGLPGLSA